MACVVEHCETEPYGGYPACSVHARTVHFAHRVCRCESCQVEQLFAQLANDQRALSDDVPLLMDFRGERITAFQERMAVNA